jgi:hypothetical protein
LGNGVFAHDYGQNSLLLDRRWFLETIAVNATEHLFLQVQVIKLLDCFIPIGLEGYFVILIVTLCGFVFFLSRRVGSVLLFHCCLFKRGLFVKKRETILIIKLHRRSFILNLAYYI